MQERMEQEGLGVAAATWNVRRSALKGISRLDHLDAKREINNLLVDEY